MLMRRQLSRLLRYRFRIDLDMRLPRSLPAAHFHRNERHPLFMGRTLAEVRLVRHS